MPPFATRFGPYAIVAGASEGIGAAFAHALASRGIHLVLIARREGPLRELADALAAKHGVQVVPLALDLAADDAVARIEEATASLHVGLLIFNAAAASISELCDAAHSTGALGIRVNPFWADELDEMERMIDAGVDGMLTNYPHILLRLLRSKGLRRPPEAAASL